MADKPNVTVQRKDDVTITLTVQNPDGTAYDLTGATLQLLVKAAATDADVDAKITKTITATPTADGSILAPETNGVAEFLILNANTAALGVVEDNIEYFLGVKLKTSAGKYHTVVDGRIDFLREVVSSVAF